MEMEISIVLYSEESNLVKTEPLRSRDKHDVMRAIERRIKLLTTDGDVPTIWRMDNGCRGEIKSYCVKHDIKLELAPPGNHRNSNVQESLTLNDCDSEQLLATLPLGRNLVPSYPHAEFNAVVQDQSAQLRL